MHVPIAKLSQGIGYFLRIASFRPDQPKREDEGQMRDRVPFLSQVPDGMSRLLLAKSDCLITDKETGGGGRSACEPVKVEMGHRRNSALEKARTQPALCEKTAQKRDRRLRCRIELGIARSFQLVNLFDHLSVQDNVALAIFSREGRTRRLLSLADADTGVRDEGAAVLKQFGLDGRADSPAGGLSQGERKLLDVAVAYALRPKLLFLDEPTSGVSTREKAPIMDIITQVVRSGGITAVIVEHDMDVVFTYCPRIIAMHQGTILADGSPEQIRSNAQVTANMLGT